MCRLWSWLLSRDLPLFTFVPFPRALPALPPHLCSTLCFNLCEISLCCDCTVPTTTTLYVFFFFFFLLIFQPFSKPFSSACTSIYTCCVYTCLTVFLVPRSAIALSQISHRTMSPTFAQRDAQFTVRSVSIVAPCRRHSYIEASSPNCFLFNYI